MLQGLPLKRADQLITFCRANTTMSRISFLDAVEIALLGEVTFEDIQQGTSVEMLSG